MSDPRRIRIEDYTYALPEERIAQRPLPERDASKLLVYENGALQDDAFRNITERIPPGALLVFNESSVLHARLPFRKPSGGAIELFCLEPAAASMEQTLQATGETQWWCLVGGMAKWTRGLRLECAAPDTGTVLYAELLEQHEGRCRIGFSWTPAELRFSQVLQEAGRVPLPPYMKRAAEPDDAGRYQTVFAKEEGSVAAPTAGLHFTRSLLDALRAKGVRTAQVTLHVGAGTFKPVQSATMQDHPMHPELISVARDTIAALRSHGGPVVCVGTTAARTVESLYWIGNRLRYDPAFSGTDLSLDQWEPYEAPAKVPVSEAMGALLDYLDEKGQPRLVTRTRLIIAPGYTFMLTGGLVTNFHQPYSTLLLLVAAFIGEDWRVLYAHALAHDYRFLSYGDACLLWRKADPNP